MKLHIMSTMYRTHVLFDEQTARFPGFSAEKVTNGGYALRIPQVTRGQPPASRGIECPGSLAVQGFRGAERGLLRRCAARK